MGIGGLGGKELYGIEGVDEGERWGVVAVFCV